MKRRVTMLVVLCLLVSLLAGCGSSGGNNAGGGANGDANSSGANSGVQDSASSGKKTMIIGDTTFNPENAEPDVNPHNDYAGWATIRYGIGETLFKLSDDMELTPWLATDWKSVDENTWEITLRDGVTFSSGRAMDAEAVKQCLEHLVENHDRAPGDLMLDEITAEGNILTLKTKEPRPALLNYLCDPYGCIIDVDAGFEDGIVAGTGPYIAVDCVSGDHLKLVKNENYWGGTPHIDELTIRTISNGDTLSSALAAGDIDAAYGMAYEAYPLFAGDNYRFSQIATSRAFFCWMNYESPLTSDPVIRKAIAMGINKEGFVATLLDGNGEVATGAFPDSFSFGGSTLKTETYDPEGAKALLEEAGWDGSQTLQYYIPSSDSNVVLASQIIEQQLAAVGIKIQINTVDFGTLMEVAGKNEFDFFSVQYTITPTDYWADENSLVNSEESWTGGWMNETVSEQLEVTQTDPDENNIKAAYLAVDKVLMEEVPMFSLYFQSNMSAVNNRVKNANPTFYGTFNNIYEWDVE